MFMDDCSRLFNPGYTYMQINIHYAAFCIGRDVFMYNMYMYRTIRFVKVQLYNIEGTPLRKLAVSIANIMKFSINRR